MKTKSRPTPFVAFVGHQGDALRIEAGVLGAEESQSAGYGDKSQSPQDGGKIRANKIEWRIAA